VSSSQRKELLTFLVVGLTTVLLDYLFYFTFLKFDFLPSIAKGLSFLLGAIFAFVANSKWTFQMPVKPQRLPIFFLLYLSSLVTNVAINFSVMRYFGTSLFVLNIAFIVATSFSAAMNFLGMKFWVFKGIK